MSPLVTRVSLSRALDEPDSGETLLSLDEAASELRGLRYPLTGGRLGTAREALLEGLQITTQDATYLIYPEEDLDA